MPSSTKVILLVDDEPSVRILVKKILESEGYAVDVAETGDEGLGKLRDIKPDLMILDMMMPGRSGLEVCKRLRAVPEWADIKVIFLTVMRGTKKVKKQLEDLKVSDYIEKPFNVSELVDRVNKVLR